MNERIEKLLEQCQIETYGVNDELLEIGFDAEKFGELIVRECLDKISGLVVPEEAIQPIGSYEKWNQALGHAALEIEQHFYGDAHE